jgi:hypothetical protein
MKKWLNRLYCLEKEIKLDRRELKRIREAATRGTGSYEAERISGTSERSRVETYACKAADLSSKIEAAINRSLDIKQDIYDAIMTVEENDLRLILKLRHLEFKKWYEIADEMNYCEYHLRHRLYRKALSKVKKPARCS